MVKSKQQILRYIVCGVITAIFNVVFIYILIETFKINTPVFRNIANLVAIEISLLFSFFVYKTWVWSSYKSSRKEILWKQIPRYHISCGVVVVSRIFLIFPILDWLKVNYQINTLIGIALGSVINYIISDKWVFNNKTNTNF
ncbi:GtrA family protein [Gloeothece verrucosa]|uniref:GtrA family protein n=1 Tax=Gloeothece verrucosa (strain PCC 7822) TaxID=497965 RepID=E0UL19_GLOV7|nr:GtrA family protein [Gloeothece verrucosa]ADN17649.1 GtrA family protein [Gloeothece verrucosa PCC 7822]